jgi:hypothetical protein
MANWPPPTVSKYWSGSSRRPGHSQRQTQDGAHTHDATQYSSRQGRILAVYGKGLVLAGR